ncbi:MAG: alpha/beta hydrolase [Chloroflexi bacterium]|nr:alpha/beta hydrolase [Chloroflexota bacterium]MCC6892248.1 alpha/beta fold hydrolase [Anaerolineae bacterium]
MPTFQHGTAVLHYEVDGSGPDAVYIPGMGSHSNDLLGQTVRQMLGQKYRLLTVDNRGSGQTATQPNDTSNLADMADDVAAVMAHIGMDNARVLGISMGGMVALSLAVKHPERINRLVVAVTSARTPDNPSRSAFLLASGHLMRENNIPLEYINRHNAVMLLGESVFSDMPFIVDAWVNAPPDPMGQTQAGFELQSNAILGYDVRDSLKTLNIPTLVLGSSEDMLVPPRYQNEIVGLIPGAEIGLYPGGHVYMMLPPYTSQFYADVLGFWGRS